MMEKPISGILMKDETLLIVGCAWGYLCQYSLANPTLPSLMNNIKLTDNGVQCVLKMSEYRVLCG